MSVPQPPSPCNPNNELKPKYKMKRLTRFITLFLLLMGVTSTIEAQTRKTITSGGKTREYLQYVPSNLEAKSPLIISCHGMNQDAQYQWNMLSKAKECADQNRFAIVLPEGEGNDDGLRG